MGGMRTGTRREIIKGQGYDIHVIGGTRRLSRDWYHAFLRASWWAALGAILACYLALNSLFAVLYLLVGGVANAAPGSFADAFFFSVETMGTIGYGTLYPASRAANLVMVGESMSSLVFFALATGLVFARFSQTRARVAFSARAAVAPIDGVPTLMVRIGNERRRNNIVDANFRLSLMRTSRTAEGVVIYRTVDLALARSWAPALARSWMVLHQIEPGSPLYGETPESLVAADAELTLAVSGVDDTSLQAVHARHTWIAPDVVFGARLADVTFDGDDGVFVIDLRRFHDLAPSAPTAAFPYPRGGAAQAMGRGALPEPGEPGGPAGATAGAARS
jgi:inward rectifier potassium channel